MSEYHVPVLLNPSVEGLQIQPDELYVDATFGGGGHANEIIRRLRDNGHLFAFDQDEDAASNSRKDNRLTLIQSNFRHLRQWMKYYGVHGKISGILADLGVSSHQFDDPHRGFSYRADEPLDMRMNRQQNMTAADVLQNYSPEQLQELFSLYGEVTNAKTLAGQIVKLRSTGPVLTTGQLNEIATQLARGHVMKYRSQVFQALRIEVNDEIGALKSLLSQAHEVLKPGGRIVIISYHSLEDRLVKRFFKTGNFEGEAKKDFFGQEKKMWKVITKNPVEPDATEQKENPRSRSAKMRVAEKA
jgi:16S rRNA (cytosine1402-N4)-methyltransferase